MEDEGEDRIISNRYIGIGYFKGEFRGDHRLYFDSSILEYNE
jgi:hypothetical protein